jgi:hypothetical protein
MSVAATTVGGMATATATAAPTTLSTPVRKRKKYPSEYGPRKRSEARAESVHVRMPSLFRKLLEAAAEREGVSINELVLVELQPFFLRELERLNTDPDSP